MIRAQLPITKPAMATAVPVKAFSSEIVVVDIWPIIPRGPGHHGLARLVAA